MDFTENFHLLIYGPLMVNRLADPIGEKDFGDIPRLRRYMIECMARKDGVGLAAPQIGLFKQFVVIEEGPGKIIDLVNPRITRMYGREVEDFETCLSLPPDDNGCTVPRLEKVQLEASTSSLPYFREEFEFEGDVARIVQHELDHLTGTFFVDRVSVQKKRDVLDRFDWWKCRRIAQIRYAQEGNNNVDTRAIATRRRSSRLS